MRQNKWRIANLLVKPVSPFFTHISYGKQKQFLHKNGKELIFLLFFFVYCCFFFLLEYECPKHPCYLFTTFMRRCEFSARPLSPKQSRLNCIYYGDELSPKNHEIRFSSMPKCLATWADCLPCDNMLPVGWYSSTYAGAPTYSGSRDASARHLSGVCP